MTRSHLTEAESEAVVQRLLTSFTIRAEEALDNVLEQSGDVNQMLALAGIEEELPGGFIPSRPVLVPLVTGQLLAHVDTDAAPEEAGDLITRLAAEVYVAGMQKMADEAAGHAQIIAAAALNPDPLVEQALARPGALKRKAERVLKERGYALSKVDIALWSITNTRSNQEVGIVRGDAATALRWLYQHAWPETWIESIQPDLGRPQTLTETEVAHLLGLGLVGVFHSKGPDGEALGTQYFVEGLTEGKVIHRSAVGLLLRTRTRP